MAAETSKPVLAAAHAPAVAWALAASGVLGAALTLSDGHDHPGALALTLVATAASAVAVARVTIDGDARRDRPHAGTLALALGSLALDLARPAGIYMVPGRGAAIPWLTLVAAAVVACAYVPVPRAARRLRFPLLVALAAAAGAALIVASPAPRIDVWDVAQQAARALAGGRSPYADGAIGTIDTHSFGRIIDAYAYPPLTVLLALPAYLVAGDVRWASLAAHLAGAVVVWRLARSSSSSGDANREAWADLLGACVLFQPRALFVVEQAWAEPLALPFLAGFALAIAKKRPWAAAVCLGLACAVKQHFVLYLPFLALVPGLGLGGAGVAVGVALATLAPFAVWTPRGLVRGLVVHHLENPFRGDSLSIPAALSDAGIHAPTWLGFAFALAVVPFIRRVPRTAGARLLASNLAFLPFFLFGRQAFCNYYYLVESVALVAVAALASGPDAEGVAHPFA